MVQAKTVARANVAHKLARYVRATPVHLSGVRGSSQPSTSHLSSFCSTQPSEVPPRKDSETVLTLGTPLMMRKNSSKEPTLIPEPTKAENQLSPDQLSSCSLESPEEEEWSS